MATTTTAATDTESVETGGKRAALGRLRTPVERRAELLIADRTSGLTPSAFARRERIRYSTFRTWAQAERRSGGLPPAPAGRKRRRGSGLSPAVRFAELHAAGVRLFDSVAQATLPVPLPNLTDIWGQPNSTLRRLCSV